MLDDLSTSGDCSSDTEQVYITVPDRIKLEIWFREQTSEWKSSPESEHENLSLNVRTRVEHEMEGIGGQAGLDKAHFEKLVRKETIEFPKATHCIWKSSANSVSTGRGKDSMIDVLNISGFHRGVIEWKIKVFSDNGVRLGVVSSLEQTYGKPLGESAASWSYGRMGDALNNNSRVGGAMVRWIRPGVCRYISYGSRRRRSFGSVS
jgi:hypothetical protein